MILTSLNNKREVTCKQCITDFIQNNKMSLQRRNCNKMFKRTKCLMCVTLLLLSMAIIEIMCIELTILLLETMKLFYRLCFVYALNYSLIQTSLNSNIAVKC